MVVSVNRVARVPSLLVAFAKVCVRSDIKAEGQVIGLTRKLKQWDKNAALEKAMKFHGAYEKDNAQPNAAVAAALSEANKIDKLKAKFAQVLAK